MIGQSRRPLTLPVSGEGWADCPTMALGGISEHSRSTQASSHFHPLRRQAVSSILLQSIVEHDYIHGIVTFEDMPFGGADRRSRMGIAQIVAQLPSFTCPMGSKVADIASGMPKLCTCKPISRPKSSAFYTTFLLYALKAVQHARPCPVPLPCVD